MNNKRFAIKTDPALWQNIVVEVRNSDKGGKPGQWSARKAQYAVGLYKERGGKYLGSKNKENSLYRWTQQRWRTKSGKPSIVGSNSTSERYLPEEVIRKTSKKLYEQSTRLKRISTRKGKQYSSQPYKLKRILSNYLKNN